ncbi:MULTISPECIES: LysR family transcriptional regulator [unclassified Rhizobium]|uniref:LysR family transcriptional regulator n=1 Tax=unclassified Rhizobium TaxID=2613769 RepID=UPI000645AAA9|nr:MULTISPECIES: LysR family transcriptional regulator [unclassified Rhizobium]MBN8953957.1 LysR family transcriptional regulator [Rhizobium tropici]OJY72194.1 MAG: LysR family transcriptional regulator [Rhizobium sp. 60-20]RKD50957.1 DNA-binding transcriptional LysR family regulator [Rhizobium sp. WW_1]
MQGPGQPSLDQLQVFLTVVETGSFAAAGRKLGRATSAVSYTIATLEQQLGVQLFDRDRTRKPVLTAIGSSVLSEVRTVSIGVDSLRAKIRGMLGGLESEVSLVVDVMLPTSRVVDAAQAFEREFPTVTLRLHVEALGAVTQLVLSGVATVGVSGLEHKSQSGLEQINIGGVDLIPVAAPGHPLAKGGSIPPGAARDHVQLVLADRFRLTEGKDLGVLGNRTWRLSDLGSKHALLLAGIGWGSMPAPMVRADIEAGRLVQIHLPEWGLGFYPLHAIYRTETPPGPAAAWLIDRFSAQIV